MNSREKLVEMWRCATNLVILASTLAVSPARAQSCAGPAVDVDVELERRCPELHARVREALDRQQNLDPCARVRLSPRVDAISVVVQLADGRATERTVAQERDVVPTLAALLVLPQPVDDPRAEPTKEAAPEAPSVTTKQAAPLTRTLQATSAAASMSAPLARSDRAGVWSPAPHGAFGMELSAVTGARIGNGQVSAGLGAFSLLEVSGWLAGFSGRADRYHALGPGDSSSSAFELGLLGGRRLRSGNASFDLSIGFAAVFQGTSSFESRGPQSGTISESSSSTVARLLLGARASFFARSTLRPFIGMDGELGPARSAGTTVPDAPRLPLWTIGLCTGLTVGT